MSTRSVGLPAVASCESMESEIRHLRMIVAVADTGSVTRAAAELHLTPSALSHQLRDIESRLNVRVFHRVGKRMVPTPAGATFLESARQALGLLDRAEAEVRRDGRPAPIRLTTQCYTCYHWLTPIVRAHRDRHPDADIRIVPTATQHPAAALLDGHVDIAVMSHVPRDRRLATTRLFDDELMVVMAPDHPMAGKSYIEPAALIHERVLLYPPLDESVVYRDVLAPAGVPASSVQLIALTEAIFELTKAGLGVSIQARWAVAPHVAAGTLAVARLTRKGCRRTWSAVTLSRPATRPHLAEFINELTRQAGAPTTRRVTPASGRRARR